MEKEELTKLADDLLHIAIGKCDSLEDAQDLVQNTLLEGLLAIRKGTKIEHAKSWLITVLNRKYYDLLREKYRRPIVFYGMTEDIEKAMSDYESDLSNPECDFGSDQGELTEEENIRRLVAGMTKLYREVLVRHYFHGQGIREIWKYVEEGLNELRAQAYYKRQNESQAAKLEGFFVLHAVYDSVIKVRDEIAGHTAFSDYPYRKDGGRWFAMGNRYPADYNYGECPYEMYEISGEAGAGFKNWPGATWVALYDYDTSDEVLGRSHSAYRCAEIFTQAREGVTKLLYAAYRRDDNFLSGISQKVLESVDIFLKLDFVERTSDGRLRLNVPVLSKEEKQSFYTLMSACAAKTEEAFHDDYKNMIQNPVAVPKQISDDVPGFLRYLNTCCYFPSVLIHEARKKGLFLKGYEKPVPAVLMEIEAKEQP